MPAKLTLDQFVKRAEALHQRRYDYSRAEYLGSKAKTWIGCPEHGFFEQVAEEHLAGRGCFKCAHKAVTGARRSDTATFVEKALTVHGDRYDYTRVDYQLSSKHVTILCHEHGPFQMKPNNHLNGRGCRICADVSGSQRRKLTLEEFIARSREKHGYRYDYSRAVYRGNSQKIEIVCATHGPFWQISGGHMQGSGCETCARVAQSESQRMTIQQFIDQATMIHHEKYDYSRVAFVRLFDKIEILCPDHGSFLQTAANHLQLRGCPTCAMLRQSVARLLTQEEFLERATATHEGKYSYERAVYKGAKVDLEIICPKHGAFWQTGETHAYAGGGCPSCISKYSNPHKQVEDYLVALGVAYQSNVRSIIRPLELDIYIPSHNTAIEFNGTYWHSVNADRERAEKDKHRKKFLRCVEEGVGLLQIDELEWRDERKREIWKARIAARLGKNRSIAARKTIFSPISSEVAGNFLAENHLQGSTPAIRWCYGLHYDGELVGIVTFSFHQKSQLNLTRMAFTRGLTVVGGAQKLFKNALKLLPHSDVVTFSNNQYSNGAVYEVMGFVKDADLAPSYQWLYRNRLYNKRLCRHSRLPKLLGDLYDPNLTEHQNMFRAGARCLYDAGYQRWIFRRTPTIAPLSVRPDASPISQEVHGRCERGAAEAHGVSGCGQGIQPPDVVQGHRA